MKKRLINVMTSVSTLVLALSPFFFYKGSSIVFFGEPTFPEKNKLADTE
ncbi:MAG: hypothetical protein J5979_02135 [Lachnospiraceae bacterium]|nr:hypothetical protein [Lachnospiraceae bacterium]